MELNKKLKNHKCRTCYNATKGLKSLCKLATEEKHPPKSYGELLKELADINVMEDKYKMFTQHICGGCCRKLKAAHAFVQQAKEVNDRLLAMLEEEGEESKQVDCLQESQVDIEACLEIKVEDVDLEGGGGGGEKKELPLCEEELKLEAQEEINLANNTIEDILDTKDDNNKTDEKITLNENQNDFETILKSSDHNIDSTSDSEINKDTPNVDNANEKMDDSEDYGNDNEDSFSEDSDWDEPIIKSSPKKASKKKVSLKTDKTEIENNIIEDDIAVPCSQCNKIFKNSKALAIHQNTSHIPEDQKCSCPICGLKYTRSCNMYKHMRMFHGPDSVPLVRKPSNQERTYQCDKCSRNYVKKKHLNAHIRNKHSNENEDEKDKDKDINKSSNSLPADGNTKPKRYEQPSLCSICGGSFTSKTFLIVHMRRHTGERPFKCDLCDRAYPRKTELTVHRRLHTGEKPFVCKLCGKAFRVSGKLATHMRSHTDIRPYKCTQCERSFKYSKDLSIHFRIHTGERPYCCNVCGNTFTQSNSLKAHRMKLGHMEIAENV